MFGTIGTLFSVSGPTLTKKLLNELAISVESSTVLPFMLEFLLFYRIVKACSIAEICSFEYETSVATGRNVWEIL